VIREIKPDRSRRPFHDLDSIKLERRVGDRKAQTGMAMAAFYDEDGALSLTRVRILDSSDGGMGLLCPVEVQPGVRFSLYSGTIPLPHLTGTVARCIRDRDEFRVGLRCDLKMAA
jgi:PilZ domain-containing protein